MLNEELMSQQLTYADIDEMQEAFHAKAWSDGLPVMPPTVEKVRAMVAGARRSAREVLGVIPPRWAEATVEHVAVNAVMAGCLPAHMPVLVTAIEAVCDPRFGLYSVQATTHPCGIAIMVSGPLAAELGIHSGYGMFGPGFRANACIGRAMRLVLRNVGGGLPGAGDHATQGTPAKFSYCFAENEAATPWAPYRVDAGFRAEDSTVTVVAAEAPHNINDHFCASGRNILLTAASTMATIGHNNSGGIQEGDLMVVLGPEHARQIADDGMSRRDVQEFLFEHARIPIRVHRDKAMWKMHEWPKSIDINDDDVLVPIVGQAGDIHVVVAGGAGKHSAFIPTFGLQKSITRKIDRGDY